MDANLDLKVAAMNAAKGRDTRLGDLLRDLAHGRPHPFDIICSHR
jgi:hypothetical protein